ncbi:transcriptional regulator, Spx/MgsR family [Cnuella takakiae]|uniref:Transcriptional regulator, Spx/MgsR family n=1 Tax=Cnuella takakiae TaxID=1302690 RepID=A0A1M5I7I6_9BACT|nr:ArsC family reductase [Cnuella takakiae]OLY93201.1 ArsC family reductase [Cnuella takakiae]SHG24137.1 transcriptional regulator, Spx/MgsR family [Cnuella takakiae]
MIKVYGILNCNTVKKATTWLQQHNIAFTFHDYKKQGITEKQLQQWAAELGFEKLVNTKGTTWRGLSDVEKATAATEAGALKLMQEKTSVIKRPLIEKDGKTLCLGYDEAAYRQALL